MSESSNVDSTPETYTCERHGVTLLKVTQVEAKRLGVPFGCDDCKGEIERAPDPATMTREARAEEIRSLLGAPLTVPFDVIWQRIDALVGRATWNHEMAQPDLLAAEARDWKHPADLEGHVIGTLKDLAGDKPVVVMRPGEGQ